MSSTIVGADPCVICGGKTTSGTARRCDGCGSMVHDLCLAWGESDGAGDDSGSLAGGRTDEASTRCPRCRADGD
ncbi:MAG: hypothetical protein ABEJ28_09310 [Salinigranum sp.]